MVVNNNNPLIRPDFLGGVVPLNSHDMTNNAKQCFVKSKFIQQITNI